MFDRHVGFNVFHLVHITNKAQNQRHKDISHFNYVKIFTTLKGNTQGPFDSVKMFGWFKEGYFGMDLKIRSSTDTQFTQLGASPLPQFLLYIIPLSVKF